MNVELKPIAESKVRQLGGDVCGVLVRTDGGVMAVSEHGRCTRLDGGVMGPVDGAQGGEWLIQMRGEYLKTRGVWERPDHRGYTNDINEAGRYSEDEAKEAERMMPEKCKAVRLPTARAQGGQEVEPVAKDIVMQALDNLLYDNYELSYAGYQNRKSDADLIRSFLGTHSRPAKQGVMLECAHCGGTGDVSGEYPGVMCPACGGTCKVYPQPAQQGGVPEEVIKAAVDRFLCWKLPEDFYPDAGVSFDRAYEHHSPHWPVGTNILTAEQAEKMFKECLHGEAK